MPDQEAIVSFKINVIKQPSKKSPPLFLYLTLIYFTPQAVHHSTLCRRNRKSKRNHFGAPQMVENRLKFIHL